MKMLLVLLASCLILARGAPHADDAERLPSPTSDDLGQIDITPEEIPMGFPMQGEIPEQTEIELPLLVRGEPQFPGGFTPRGFKPDCTGSMPCARRPYKLPEFPPGRPTDANLANICSAGRRKISYGPWNLPQTSYTHLARQGDALNHLETGLGQCCHLPENEKLPCSVSVWEETMTRFCKDELSVKTKHHPCCKLHMEQDQHACFAIQAPYPDYDKEVRLVSLAEVTPFSVDLLCGQVTLLSKQRYIPALVKNITESCCSLSGDERPGCASEVKSEFITALCDTERRRTWKDPENCCDKTEEEARQSCFNLKYLTSIPLASSDMPLQPTVLAE